ncbi:MAG: leucine-rich repeat domain-containing protein [Carboxylicivirga sp.]|jgi:GTPase SAR1 family protein|nr:leucine-rich repeat domain-containing protein [Carboxylicivirga sp.]
MNDFLNDSIFDVESDLLVIPISTEGTISISFRRGLEKLNISPDVWEKESFELGVVKVLTQKSHNRYIAFACTVDKFKSAYFAIKQIGKRLAEKVVELDNIKEIATPILGTGAGNLLPEQSLNIMRTAFYENEKAESVRLTFCTPEEEIHNSVRSHIFDIDSPSALLVIEAEKANIYKDKSIERILNEKEFYFRLAEEKYNEYLECQLSKDFYAQLSGQFKLSGLTFKEFIKTDLSKEQRKFVTLCGELIAYIDYNAYHKNIWNKYPDKRIMARSSVRQNAWFLNLIKFKLTDNIASLSPSIKNAFNYLTSPEVHTTMLSENHRKKVFESIVPKQPYDKDEFEGVILNLFEKFGIKPINLRNSGALYSRILYLPFIKPIWNENSKKNDLNEVINPTDLTIAISLIEDCLKNNLKRLDLGNCGLKNLEVIPELFECTHIEELILSNEWADYENGKWKKWTSDNKGEKNCILSLPDSISELSELRILICGGDWNKNEGNTWNRWGITSLGPVTRLSELEYLNLSNNKLTSIIGLNKLVNLKIAHLNNNEISRPVGLSDLQYLKELYLSNNKIKTVDFISENKNIETLDLHNNLIQDLRPLKSIITNIGISNDKWEVNTLNIAKNPLEQPPMTIVNLGKDAVIGIFEDIEKRGRYINKDIKLILVGNSEVGKSTLVKYMDKENGLDEEHLPTLWMDERIIKSKYSITAIGEECQLHIFDFGGHDYYHDTHHIFYGTNTIYLLLWDKKTNNLNSRKTLQRTKENQEIEIETQDYPLKYWLDSVKFYTKDVEADNFEFEIMRKATYNSSLLLIQNKVDDVAEIVFLDGKSLKRDYSFIHDMINMSIKPKRNLNHFDNMLWEMLDKMKIIGAVLPRFYEPIKKSITSYNGKPVLSFPEFMNHCNSKLKNSIDEEQGKRLVKYLVQVGLVLCANRSSEEKIYMNKKWVIENMHKVLEKLTERKGEFKRDYVVKTLGEDDNRVDDLLTMMEEFKIVFKHPHSDTYIAPLYLPKIPDGKVSLFLNSKQIPYRRFEYNGFIHKSVILSIFQKFGAYLPFDQNKDIYYYWKDGLIVKNPTTEEIVMIKFYLGNENGSACIDIYDLNHSKQPKFRDEVLTFIREVNKGYELEEMVTVDGEDYISKDLLEKNAKIGKYIFSEKKLTGTQNAEKKQKLYKLKDYMDFIDNTIKKKKVVISYSKKDLPHIHTLRRYLQPLVDAELIEQPWYCTNLNPGDDWDAKIKHKFEEADIIFFMVSEYFYSTRYIIDHEIKTAIDRYDNGEDVKIIPIILEFYDWGRKHPYNLQRFSALPYQAKPLSDFKNPKMIWNTITASVKMMIEKDLDPGKTEIIGRDLEEIYERQVKGKLDNNSL